MGLTVGLIGFRVYRDFNHLSLAKADSLGASGHKSLLAWRRSALINSNETQLQITGGMGRLSPEHYCFVYHPGPQPRA